MIWFYLGFVFHFSLLFYAKRECCVFVVESGLCYFFFCQITNSWLYMVCELWFWIGEITFSKLPHRIKFSPNYQFSWWPSQFEIIISMCPLHLNLHQLFKQLWTMYTHCWRKYSLVPPITGFNIIPFICSTIIQCNVKFNQVNYIFFTLYF